MVTTTKYPQKGVQFTNNYNTIGCEIEGFEGGELHKKNSLGALLFSQGVFSQ